MTVRSVHRVLYKRNSGRETASHLPGIARKKDRVVFTTRSKSREETPKEGMDRKNLPDDRIIVRRTNVNRHQGFLIQYDVEIPLQRFRCGIRATESGRLTGLESARSARKSGWQGPRWGERLGYQHRFHAAHRACRRRGNLAALPQSGNGHQQACGELRPGHRSRS
ncbi:hypothetical protein MPLSOD_140463 [Mesorhizobium sp. SOD10]|nr:hypothetical protein MPLSOD_140463 [Mesorhizobium sp. SOD10]